MFTSIEYHTVLTVMFFIAFISMGVWVFWPKRKTAYEDAANIPFIEEPGSTPRTANKEGETK